MYKNDEVIRHYSEPFKLKILAELTIGKHTKSELCKLYSIAPTTVNEWIKKYNRKDLMNTRVKVETKDEISRIKALQKEIEQLKKLLLKKQKRKKQQPLKLGFLKLIVSEILLLLQVENLFGMQWLLM